MPELLAPAGNLEKLTFAVNYGADSVYFGLDKFSLRSFAGNFSFEEANDGLKYLHKQGKKGFCTLNIYPFENEYKDLVDAAKQLDDMNVDAIIVADLGVLNALKKNGIKAAIHISTQANTVSAQTVLTYAELGASRVNLARELTFDQIVHLQNCLEGAAIETEIFVHGSVCFSYSGRCSISDYLTGRQANRGECTHPCRWQYHLVEEKRPGEFMAVEEDDRGLYLFNSKDLALYSYMERLIKTGVTSFKIEGRMKSIHYLASVLSLYRRLMDGEMVSDAEARLLLSRIKNRGYSEGFMKGQVTPDDYKFENNTQASSALFLANSTTEKVGELPVWRVRNKIISETKVEILKPDGSLDYQTIPKVFKDSKGNEIDVATYGEIILPFNVPPFSIMRQLDTDSKTLNNASGR